MQLKQPKTIQEYASNRNKLLEDITQVLKEDHRFVAAWLTGSFGRGDADKVSDLDLTVVVENSFAKICASALIKSEQVPPQSVTPF